MTAISRAALALPPAVARPPGAASFRFFRDLPENAIRRGVFTSVADRMDATDVDLIEQDRAPKAFIWGIFRTDSTACRVAMSRIHHPAPLALLALFVCACGTSAPPDELPPSLLNGDASVSDSGTVESPDGSAPGAPDSGTPQMSDAGLSTLPDGGPGQVPDSGSSIPTDAGMNPTPDAGVSGHPDSGTSETPDSGVPENPDSGTTGKPDAGGSGRPDAGTGEMPDSGPGQKPDSGTSSTPCATTSDCSFNETCETGHCAPATTCANQTGPCPAGTTMQTIPFEQCGTCPNGTVQIPMQDDPDAGFDCDGGIGYSCLFSRCIPDCSTQSDCPDGLFCIAVTANQQECLPLGLNGSPTLATLQCISGEANPGGGCASTSECAFDQVCSGGTCVSSPSCGTDTGSCPQGTADEPVYTHQCASCPAGTVTVANPNNPDAGVACAGGSFNICVVDRCLIECNSPLDCPTGLACAPQTDHKQVCFPIYPGTIPTQEAAECVGE